MAQEIITDQGLVKPTLAECIQQIGDALESELGVVNREADSVTGQWIGVEAEANAVHFEALEYLWSSRFLSTATGYALDAIGQWLGIARLAQSATHVNAVIIGSESTTVPAGSLAGFGNSQFKLDADAVISRSQLVQGTIRIADISPESFTIRINGQDYQYTKKDTDTLADVATGLVTLIQSTQIFTATSTGSSIEIRAVNLVEGYPVSVNTGLDFVAIGSPARFTATETGAIILPVGGLSTPISAVSGWTGVTNLVAGSTGSARESDGDYRRRLLNSKNRVSAVATADAIEARLLNEVEGVTFVHVIENDTMSEKEGMPPKSIQVVVRGGLEQAIANAVWLYKGAGIETYGEIQLTAYDRHGKAHTVAFSRPKAIKLYVNVAVNLLDEEEALTSNVITAIKQGVLNYATTLSLGDDFITQRVYGYIYANTTGIGKMTVTVSTDGSNFSEGNISVAESAVIELVTDNIEVSGV